MTNQYTLSPRSKTVHSFENEYDFPPENKLTRVTSEELPGFLKEKSSDQFMEDDAHPEQDLEDAGQRELEYSDIEEAIEFDFDEDDE